jgi:hypothetical protein
VRPSTIDRAREIIAAATRPPYALGTIAGAGPEEWIAALTKMILAGDAGQPPYTLVVPDPDEPDLEKSSLSVAITGNGPTSRANALYLLHSHDSVGGWLACLDEVVLLRGLLKRALDAVVDAHGKSGFDDDILAIVVEAEHALAGGDDVGPASRDAVKLELVPNGGRHA